MVTAAARPRVFWIGKDGKPVRGWPVGHALLEALGGMNEDVQEALADERARLCAHGYPPDLPLPALWWTRPASRSSRQSVPRRTHLHPWAGLCG